MQVLVTDASANDGVVAVAEPPIAEMCIRDRADTAKLLPANGSGASATSRATGRSPARTAALPEPPETSDKVTATAATARPAART